MRSHHSLAKQVVSGIRGRNVSGVKRRQGRCSASTSKHARQSTQMSVLSSLAVRKRADCPLLAVLLARPCKQERATLQHAVRYFYPREHRLRIYPPDTRVSGPTQTVARGSGIWQSLWWTETSMTGATIADKGCGRRRFHQLKCFRAASMHEDGATDAARGKLAIMQARS